ncbi:hypothetical protein NFJ02_31g79220 [Pycnococcus provasolii]
MEEKRLPHGPSFPLGWFFHLRCRTFRVLDFAFESHVHSCGKHWQLDQLDYDICGEPLRRISRRRNVRAATHAGLRHGVIVRKRCTDDMCQAVHEFDHVKYVSDDRLRYIILNSALDDSPRNWICAR